MNASFCLSHRGVNPPKTTTSAPSLPFPSPFYPYPLPLPPPLYFSFSSLYPPFAFPSLPVLLPFPLPSLVPLSSLPRSDPVNLARESGGALWAPPVGFGAEPRPQKHTQAAKAFWVHFELRHRVWWQRFWFFFSAEQ